MAARVRQAGEQLRSRGIDLALRHLAEVERLDNPPPADRPRVRVVQAVTLLLRASGGTGWFLSSGVLACVLALCAGMYATLWLAPTEASDGDCAHRAEWWCRLLLTLCAYGVGYTFACSMFYRQLTYKLATDIDALIHGGIARRYLRWGEPLAWSCGLFFSLLALWAHRGTDPDLCSPGVRRAHSCTLLAACAVLYALLPCGVLARAKSAELVRNVHVHVPDAMRLPALPQQRPLALDEESPEPTEPAVPDDAAPMER